MAKVEDDFMAKAPTDPMELMHFIDEIPYWTAKKHGKKYRLMYQVYTHPKYIEHGKQFFKGVSRRYMEYAISLEAKLGIPCEVLTLSLIHICWWTGRSLHGRWGVRWSNRPSGRPEARWRGWR